ncbi:hypothetical protein ACIBU0_06420 [Streptomyces sp. NPDC049627]|uniref:hypothetical protein n=1 Tax=Streptomyces sp. NPDC049627 TaxID=3365595 RepID=UPI0037A49E9F
MRSARARAALVGALLLCMTAALPGGQATATATAAAAAAAETPSPYAFTPDARSVTGAPGPTDATPLAPGATYKSSLPSSGEIYYSLRLDATSDTYVSVTAVPAPGSTVSASDGIKVSMKDAEGGTCSLETKRFGVVHSARPIAAWARRESSGNRNRCKSAGTYYLTIERVGTTAAAADAWDLELFATSEPPLKKAEATSAPETWNSASPTPPTGDDVPREGGSGFASAAFVGQGVWSSGLRPGQTLFYKVPLDWGRQLYATAELDSSNGGDGYLGNALSLALYNPARGLVDYASANYDLRRQDTAELDPLPPVAYENRYAIPERYKGMRFAGSYYLVVHLAAEMAEKYGNGPFGMTLRVRVGGETEAGPGYAGESEPRGVFEVSPGDRAAAAAAAAAGDGAGGGAGGGGDAAMTVLAVSGIGAGTVVLLVLGVWAVVARRRAEGQVAGR